MTLVPQCLNQSAAFLATNTIALDSAQEQQLVENLGDWAGAGTVWCPDFGIAAAGLRSPAQVEGDRY